MSCAPIRKDRIKQNVWFTIFSRRESRSILQKHCVSNHTHWETWEHHRWDGRCSSILSPCFSVLHQPPPHPAACGEEHGCSFPTGHMVVVTGLTWQFRPNFLQWGEGTGQTIYSPAAQLCSTLSLLGSRLKTSSLVRGQLRDGEGDPYVALSLYWTQWDLF